MRVDVCIADMCMANARVFLLSLSSITALMACPLPQEVTQNDVTAHIDSQTGILTLARNGQNGVEPPLQFSVLDMQVRQARAAFEMQFGMFNIEESAPDWTTGEQIVVVDTAADAALSFDVYRGRIEGQEGEKLLHGDVIILDDNPHAAHVVVRWQSVSDTPDAPDTQNTKYNRVRVGFDCGADEHFIGMGAHTHETDFRGQNVPLWVSEQGIGKTDNDELPAIWQLTGRRHTTHIPIPAYTSSRGYAAVLDTSAFSQFNFCLENEKRIYVENWQGQMQMHFLLADTSLAAVQATSALAGRPPVPPPWAFAPWNDAIFGTDAVRAYAEQVRAAKLPSSAMWSEDWRGGKKSGESYRLDEDWRLDEDLYPNYIELNQELRRQGFMPMVYFNTFLTQGYDVLDEAVAGQFAIAKQTQGYEPFLFTGADAAFSPTGLADLTDEAGRTWTKSFLQSALDVGAKGWMADFAEWMPVDDVRLADGSDPALTHNRYPVLWQQTNQEILNPQNAEILDADAPIAFYRSGYWGSQPLAQIMWGGDQRTSFKADDGFPTVIPIGLGLAATGFPYYTHDVGGYQSATNPPRSQELFWRWTALGALTPVMRTHHGTHAAQNWHIFSDAATTALYKKYAQLHVQLYPYWRALALRAHTDGIPMWISMGLQHPTDAASWSLLDQFYVGDALLVAPVVTEGAISRTVHLPAGRFVEIAIQTQEAPADTHTNLLAQRAYQNTNAQEITEIAAPLDVIPLFLREGGIIPMLALPVDTLLSREKVELAPELTSLEDTEGDRFVYIALGKDGSFIEESGASYVLTMSDDANDANDANVGLPSNEAGIFAPAEDENTGEKKIGGFIVAADGSILVEGNANIVTEDFTLILDGHPTTRKTHIYFW